MIIEMGHFSVTVKRKSIKNINLRVQRTGEVQISVPLKTPLSHIHDFLHNKRAWIETHRKRLQALDPQGPQHLITGESIYFQGISYLLQVHETQGNSRVELIDNQFHLFVKPTATLTHKQKSITQWYITQMQQHLPHFFEKWQTIIGVCASRILIKRLKSRWGSCHPKSRQITLNLCLMEKPLICLEYVIVHELVHLLEASHNARFYALMDQYLPGWKAIRKLLN